MKILFLTGGQGLDCVTEELSPLGIFNTATVYNYFLRRELSRVAGIETSTYRFAKISDEEKAKVFLRDYSPPSADHVVCLEQRGFSLAHKSIFEFYRARTAGAVCAICDHDIILGPEDYLFHVQMTRHHPPDRRSVHVTWAASPEYCYPEKEPGTLNILVDHNQYKGEDRADEILCQLCEFARTSFSRVGPRYGFDRMVIRQFKSGGIETIDVHNPQKFGEYNRKGLPFPEACREYRRANMFFVTKPESMGLSIIESAMSGALIVVPRGFANDYLLGPLNYVSWGYKIEFEELFASLDVGWSADVAAPFCWQRLAQTMLNTLRLH